MNASREENFIRIVSGEKRGVGALMLRAGLAMVSPLYSLAIRVRNAKYDRGMGVRRLARPVVSVGNITTGGTGKTPVVRWLCERLLEAGERPAVLMRGYKAKAGGRGDEERMLEDALKGRVVIRAEADRHLGGLAVLRAHPEVSVLVLDDGFQHRRLARDFDLVLIDASEPFGFGHVLPRGLLREPLSGLARADAVLITRADQGKDVEGVVREVRRSNSDAPVYRCSHVHLGFVSMDGEHRLEEIAGKRVFAVAGIGNPLGFERQLRAAGAQVVGHRWFADHWDYSSDDLRRVEEDARAAGADVIMTTEKDWVKIARFANERQSIPIWRAELGLRFEGDDERTLFEQIRETCAEAHPRK